MDKMAVRYCLAGSWAIRDARLREAKMISAVRIIAKQL